MATPTLLDTPRGVSGKINRNTNTFVDPTQQYAPAPSAPVIAATSLQTPQQPYKIPQPDPQPSTSNLALTTSDVASKLKAEAEFEPPKNEGKEELSVLRQALTGQVEGIADQENQIREEEGIYEKRKLARAEADKLDRYEQEYRDEVANLRKNADAYVGTGLQDKINEVTDLYENKRANVALTYKTLAGDYNEAAMIVNDKVQSLRNQLSQNIELYKLASDAVNNDLTESEKLQVQANLNKKQAEDTARLTAYQAVLENAAKNGAPASVLAAIDAASRKPGATSADIFAAAGTYAGDPLYTLQLQKLRTEISLLGQPTAEERKLQAEALRNAETAIPLLQDKVNLIDTLLTHPGLASQVGPNNLARIPVTAEMTGAAQEFLGGVNQLINKETIDTLVNLKERGGTLGALSDTERVMLQQAASKLGTWQIKEGNQQGKFNVSEAAFKAELKNIQDLANRALIKARGSIYTDEEEAAFQSLNESALTPDMFYR